MRQHVTRWRTGLLAALLLLARGGLGRASDDPKTRPLPSWPPPMTARTAATWIRLHETTLRPLPDRTPLGQVLRALREATRGKDGKGKEIDFHISQGVLAEVEATLDTPVRLPFPGQPEVSIDTYLKYMLRQFGMERSVHDGYVVIDAPCDDCEGYATVSAAEAHAWLLLHQVVPLRFPEKTPLGKVIEAMTEATRGRGFQGRGLAISAVPRLLREPSVWNRPVTIVADGQPLGASLEWVLQPPGLDFRVLSDGNILILAARKTVEPNEDDPEWMFQDEWDSDFPMYRSTYSAMWRDMIEAYRRAGAAGKAAKD